MHSRGVVRLMPVVHIPTCTEGPLIVASWREIDRLRKDPVAFRAVATGLLRLPEGTFTEWEADFLEDVLRKPDAFGEYTTRQGEKLLEIRDNADLLKEWRGFNVATLIQRIYEARLDLEEADEAFVVALREFSTTSVRRSQAAKLGRLAASLNLIDPVSA